MKEYQKTVDKGDGHFNIDGLMDVSLKRKRVEGEREEEGGERRTLRVVAELWKGHGSLVQDFGGRGGSDSLCIPGRWRIWRRREELRERGVEQGGGTEEE